MHTQKQRTAARTIALSLAPILLAIPFAVLAADPLHPLGSTNLQGIIGRVISAFLGLLGSISLVMFVWGGFLYMTASGNDEQVKKAKKTFRNAIIGIILAFGSYAILNFVLGSLDTALKK